MRFEPKRRATLASVNERPDVLQDTNGTDSIKIINTESNNLVGPPASCPFSAIHHLTNGGPVKVTNYTNSRQIVDSLHLKTNGNYCLGSLMQPGQRMNNEPSRPEKMILKQAVDFFQEYFHSKKHSNDELSSRLIQVKKELDASGTYTHTKEELEFGARTAWRNASRCIGRIQWNKLDLFDFRHVKTTAEMFVAICEHIKKATNDGNIKSCITIFPQRIAGRDDFRLWNPQLVSFAGYLQTDGSVIGDPSKVQFTRVCEKLGWKGKGTRWDILPIILSAPGEDPTVYEVPEDIVLTVPLSHPTFEWFESLELKWYCLPAVSDMLFDVGGIEFPAAPFNGWYMGTEIGCRDICDEQRYNMMPTIGKLMGLDLGSEASLWKDKVLVEANVAVLHSFAKAGVTIVDHHTASQSFVTHMANETKVRGGCPADWVWITPPLSGSATSVYHQEMLNYHLKPAFDYQEAAWKSYTWKKITLKYSLKSVVTAVIWSARLISIMVARRVKVTILYATETGKSESFADKLELKLSPFFKIEKMRMEDYDVNSRLEKEKLLFIVASTFGNGDPPDNGKSFWKALSIRARKAKNSKTEEEKETFFTRNLTFAVFGLGSSVYPTFGAFAKNVDRVLFEDLHATRLKPVIIGDEMRGQEKLFINWKKLILQCCIKKYTEGGKFIPEQDEDFDKMFHNLLMDSQEDTFEPELVRLQPVKRDPNSSNNENASPAPLKLISTLSKIHGEKRYQNLFNCQIISKQHLLPENNRFGRQTMLVRLRPADSSSAALSSYSPGDHLGVFPSNPTELVDGILSTITKTEVNSEEFIQKCVDTEYALETRTSNTSKEWMRNTRLPPCSLKEAFTHYLDITSIVTRVVLTSLASMATDAWDKIMLEKLSKDPESYKKWRDYSSPDVLDILKKFPSVEVPPEFLLLRLPLLSPRLYSISSSLKAAPGEIHLTMSIVSWTPDSGTRKYGVCTNFFDKSANGPIPCYVRVAPSFRPPTDLSLPVIMIGAGSGIAPFRGFWQERDVLVSKRTLRGRRTSITNTNNDPGVGNCVLFFGCRSTKIDTLYSKEIESLVSRGIINEVFLALTREEGVKKRYVQDMLHKQRKLVHEMITEGAHIYVCGDAVMAEGVRTSFIRIFEEIENLDPEAAHDTFDELRDQQRYHEDVFGILKSSS